jgi:glycosyltransferase involved in cell wall biosynthesis
VSGPIRLAFFLPHLRPGGAERVVVNYLRALDRSRFQPFLFLGSREGAFLDLVPADVTVVDLGGARARTLPRRVSRELEQRRIDLAYSATDAANLALLASRWFGARNTKRIVSVHTTPSSWLAEAKHPRLRRWLMARLYPSAALVAVPTEAIAAELKQLLARPALATAVLPNPVVDEVATGHVKPPGARLRIVAAGRLVEAKGFDLLIEAAAGIAGRSPPFDLAVYGEGPLRGALSRQAGESVTLPGHAEAHAMFQEADLCVVPSRREGFGNVVVEAMAAGVPVLATACPGPAALIEHGRNGFLVEPGSSSALAEAMAALLADPQRRCAVVDAGRRTARRFEVGEATRRFEEAVERLLGKERPGKHPDPGHGLH